MTSNFINIQQAFWTEYTGRDISDDEAKEISSNLLAFTRQVIRMNEILKESEKPMTDK